MIFNPIVFEKHIGINNFTTPNWYNTFWVKQCLIIKKWLRFSQQRWVSSDLNEIEKTSVLKFENLKKCLKFDNIKKIVHVSISSLFNIEI